jgi:hypothetical protein
MVVLAVTWMAKAGHEAEVASMFAKLTEESRKEPGCRCIRSTGTRPNRAASSFTSSTRTTPRSKPTAALRTSCSTPAKDPRIADRVEGHLFEPARDVGVWSLARLALPITFWTISSPPEA